MATVVSLASQAKEIVVHWTGWVVLGLVVIAGGWMLFDGLHALTTGDFVTPGSGAHAGRLGPWANAVSGIGLDPRSMPVKLVFVGYGSAYLAAGVAFVARTPGMWWALIVLAVLGLWYLPIGTVANLTVVVLLVMPSLRMAA